jgi:hypothetical protein
MSEQLMLFQETHQECLEKEIKDIREEWTKTRKSLYARHANLMHLYLEQRAEIEALKAEMHKVA